jgi:hypothetical protein
MEYNQFKQLLQLKGIREKETVLLLEDFIEKFPYCQTSRLLFVKALHDQHNILYDQNLKLAAAYASNREVLRDLVETKTEEVEFVFPLGGKAEQAEKVTGSFRENENEVISRGFTMTGNSFGAKAEVPESKKEEPFEEWYSEEEISGHAFEVQKENEKLIDPHEVIRQRLNEILAGGHEKNAAGHDESLTAQAGTLTMNGKQVEKDIPAEEQFAQADTEPEAAPSAEKTDKNIHAPAGIKDPVETEEPFVKEVSPRAPKPGSALNDPPAEKSKEEKEIITQAGKAIDVLDRMGLEHAMEESILDSLEKLPPLIPPGQASSAREKDVPVPAARIPASPGVAESASSRFSPGETDAGATLRSFTDWLRTVRTSAAPGFEEVHAPKTREYFREPHADQAGDGPASNMSDDELIEKFLLEDPKIVASKAEFYSPVSQAKKSVMDHDDVVSETLAQIYLQQGNFARARWCYEKLILFHPEKSAFFAALLKEIPEGSDEDRK